MKLTKKLNELLQNKPDAPCKIWRCVYKTWHQPESLCGTTDAKQSPIYTAKDACDKFKGCKVKIVPLQCITIMVAQNYLSNHPKKGQPTGFEQSILDGTKIHTIRADYEGWVKKAEKINAGLAYLSLRKWSGLPYHSNMVEIKRLFSVGVQKIEVAERYVTLYSEKNEDYEFLMPIKPYPKDVEKISIIAKNDGFAICWDLINWFGIKPFEGAIIHFTDFRY